MSLLLALSLIPMTHAEQTPGWAMVMPLGVPQFAQHRPTPAWVFGGVQLAAIGGATASTIAMRRASEAGNVERELQLRLVSVGVITVGAGAWFASVTEASQHEQAARAEAARAWIASAPPGPSAALPLYRTFP